MSSRHRIQQQSEEGPSSSSSKEHYMDDIKPVGYVEEDGGMIDGLEHGHQIIHEEILHDDILGGEEVEIEYIEGDEVVGAEEVVMEEDEGHIVMEDDIATESLVALSQGSHGKNKGMRTEYIQHGMPMSSKGVRNPRILRRPMERGAYVYEQQMPRQPVNPNKHNYPVPQHTKRLLPVATLPAPKGTQKDWREEQKRILEIYEIYDVLPDGMRESFKRILETKGDNIPPRNQPRSTYRIGGNQMMDSREYREQEMAMRQRPFKDEHMEQHHVEEEVKKPLDPNEYSDMPQLEEAPDTGNQGQQPTETQIDVEGYDSTDETHDPIQADVEYIMEDEMMVEMYDRGSPMKMGRRQEEVIMPEMREEYLGTMDANAYSANQLMINNQYTDTRYCPGCKLHLKRSIFYHHSRMIKKYGICNMFTPKRFPCGVQGCDERLGTVEKLCEHMFQIHGTPTDIKTEVFNNEAEFEVFLRELEAKGGNFRMSRGNKMIKAGLVQYFRCNRTQSLAKDKTMRICDEVSIFGEPVGSGVVERQDDPFSNPVTGGKPCLRTEEACTAFFRKAYMPNNTIEVRYCDHHLHEDERVRLPNAVKDRICEMHRKGLPSAVIMMVLQCEREKFALAGTCVERRVMQLTPKDISCVISTRNSNAKKRRRPGHGPQRNGDELEEDTHGSELVLTELEQKMLETFENNQEVILGDMQKMKRDENRKRNLRETLRVNIFNLGRFLKSATFTSMSSDQLAQVNEAVKIALDCTRTKEPPSNVAMQQNHHNHHMEEHREMNDEEVEAMMCGEELRETVKEDVGAVPMNIIHVPYAGHEETIDEGREEIVEVVNGGIIRNAEEMLQEAEDGALQSINSTGSLQEQLSEDRRSEEMEQIVVESDSISPPAKKRRGRRPKSSIPGEEVVVKQEPVEDAGSSPPFALPSKTRAGRVVRPSRHVTGM